VLEAVLLYAPHMCGFHGNIQEEDATVPALGGLEQTMYWMFLRNLEPSLCLL
jgi:hypothetical protein